MASFIIDDKMMHGGLGLKGCELLLFGLILSYTKLGKTLYQKEETIASRFGYSREHISRSMKSLLDKGFIIRLGRHPKAESFEYVINQSILDTYDTYIQGDIISQPIVNLDHIHKGENITQQSDVMAHNYLNNITEIREGDTAAPSIVHFDNPTLDEKWAALLKSAKWRRRTSESLAEAEKKLKSYAPELAILMITNTIEGDYPKIYDPSPEMIAKVHNMTSSSKAKTQIDSDMFKEDDTLFGKIYCIIPEIYRAVAIGQSKQRRRALSFMTNTSKSVIKVFYPSGMKDWIDEKKTTIEKTLSVEGLTTEFQYVED